MTMSEKDVDALFEPHVVQEPYAYYRELREQDPVHEVAPGTFLVTRMELVHEVVNKTGVYSSTATGFLHKGDWSRAALRPLVPGADDLHSVDVPGIIATADPPDHERQRRVLSKRFSAASIRAMEVPVRELVRSALAASLVRGRLEWMSEVAEPVPMVVVARLLGFDDEQAPALKRLGYALVDRIGGLASEEQMTRLDADSMSEVAPVVDAYLKARGGSDAYGDGIITTVARAADDGELDDVEAIGILTVLIAAGGESTTSLLGTAVRILAERPDLQQRLRTDTSLIPSFVEEALRWDPPFRGHYRIATEDTVIANTAIPAGSHVVLMWPAANRDERAYDDPDDVRLDRTNPRYHVGFGWGIHLCIGAPLARLEATVAIAELLAATRAFDVDTDEPALTYHPSLLVRRLEALPLVLDR